jgi:hypothetical protein
MSFSVFLAGNQIPGLCISHAFIQLAREHLLFFIDRLQEQDGGPRLLGHFKRRSSCSLLLLLLLLLL